MFQMDDRKAKLSGFILYSLTWTMLLSGEITDTIAVGLEAESFGKLCQNKHWINLNLSEACWQIRKNITVCEARFQRFDLLQFQNIPARCHTYLKC